MYYKCRKLFNGFASIRDTTIKICVKRSEDLIIFYDGDKMVVPIEKLRDPDKYQIHKSKFKSRYNKGQSYELYDFYFVPDKNLQPKLKI